MRATIPTSGLSLISPRHCDTPGFTTAVTRTIRGRPHGRSPAGLSGHHFLGYAQTHDQVGNRAKGERSSHLMNAGRLKIAAALVLTSPFVPMLFHGEEWGASTPLLYFSGHEDLELGRAVSEGRKREFAAFGWDPGDIPDPQARETFEPRSLNWSELDREPHREHSGLASRSYSSARADAGIARRPHGPHCVDFDESRALANGRRGRVTVASIFRRTAIVPIRTTPETYRYGFRLKASGGIVAVDSARLVGSSAPDSQDRCS